MALNIASMQADKSAQSSGVWVDYADGARFLIASTDNPRYKAEITKQVRRNKVKIEGTPNADTIALTQEITCQAIAKYILLDWEGIENDGQPLPYSQEMAYTVLSSVPEILEFVSDQANAKALFTRGEVEALKKDSTGNSDMEANAIS